MVLFMSIAGAWLVVGALIAGAAEVDDGKSFVAVLILWPFYLVAVVGLLVKTILAGGHRGG